MALPRTTRLAAIVIVVIVVAGIGLTACSSDDDGIVTESTTSTTSAAGTTIPGGSSTTSGPTSTTPSGVTAAFTFTGGDVSGASRVTAKLGEQVTIRVVSDVAEEVHVHTYDRTVDLEPGVPGEVTFTADIPGIHEVELEHSAHHLTSLEVQ